MKTNRGDTEEFKHALERAHVNPEAPQPLCAGRWAEFSDYDIPPTEREAIALCQDDEGEDCPLLALCKKSARHDRPGWGVKGGVTWIDGRQHAWIVKLKAAAAEKEAEELRRVA